MKKCSPKMESSLNYLVYIPFRPDIHDFFSAISNRRRNPGSNLKEAFVTKIRRSKWYIMRLLSCASHFPGRGVMSSPDRYYEV